MRRLNTLIALLAWKIKPFCTPWESEPMALFCTGNRTDVCEEAGKKPQIMMTWVIKRKKEKKPRKNQILSKAGVNQAWEV
jgi:hypothetical protein